MYSHRTNITSWAMKLFHRIKPRPTSYWCTFYRWTCCVLAKYCILWLTLAINQNPLVTSNHCKVTSYLVISWIIKLIYFIIHGYIKRFVDSAHRLQTQRLQNKTLYYSETFQKTRKTIIELEIQSSEVLEMKYLP